MVRCGVTILFFLLIINHELSALKTPSRQKRCIVIQRQITGHVDSDEGSNDEDDFKKPQPKYPDRLQAAKGQAGESMKNGDVETLSPELKYRNMPNIGMLKRIMMKNPFRNIF